MFKITHKDKDTKARTGLLHTPHGEFVTPFFMPVATKGAVKYLSTEDLKTIGAKNIISNSMLLYLKPGLDIIKKAGGIHKFLNFDGCIFTDSGGFQILSDFFLEKSDHDHVVFNSPYGGKKHILKPIQAVDIQLDLGSDIAMCLDDVPKYGSTHRQVKSAVLKTHSWARLQKEHHDNKTKSLPKNKRPLLFGIAQGGIYPDLREASIRFISGLDFDGIALGGLAIGETREEMFTAIDAAFPFFPENKPLYVMGLGSPIDIIRCIGLGIDCFDSIFPTRNARHGSIFTSKGRLRILREEYADDMSPIDETCGCLVCKSYTRAFIHHMLEEKEGVGYRLATYHNIYFMTRLIERARDAIKKGKYDLFLKNFLEEYRL